VMDRIENRTFDELKIGDAASLVRTLTFKDVEIFAAMSGDVSPAHVDAAFAKDDMFHKIIAHGMWGSGLFSTVLGCLAWNLLAKHLEYQAEAEAAGIVLGARVPIILTSRADKALTRLSSCALALLWAHHQSRKASAN
jgi:hypothetical protein